MTFFVRPLAGMQLLPSGVPAVRSSPVGGRAAAQSSVTTVSSCGIPTRPVTQRASKEPRASASERCAHPPSTTVKRVELQVG